MKAALTIFMLAMCTVCQAHMALTSLNGVSAATTSRNKGVYSVDNTNLCGGTGLIFFFAKRFNRSIEALGANGYTTIWPGQPLSFGWEVSDIFESSILTVI